MVEFTLFWFTGVRFKKLARFFIINFGYAFELWIDRRTHSYDHIYESIVFIDCISTFHNSEHFTSSAFQHFQKQSSGGIP